MGEPIGFAQNTPAGSLFSGSCRKPHSALAVAAVVICSQRLDVFSPEIERLTFLCGVARTIVDASDPGLVAADMVEHGFDDVRLHAELGHAGRDRASHIMQPPGADRGGLLVECELGLRPALKTAAAGLPIASAGPSPNT